MSSYVGKLNLPKCVLSHPLGSPCAANQLRGPELFGRAVLEVVGEWWSLLIVRDTFLGVTGSTISRPARDLPQHPHQPPQPPRGGRRPPARVLSDNPPRSDYRLTDKGRDLWHVITAMRQWGDRWAAPGGEPLVLQHKACGQIVSAVSVCSYCGEALDARSVTALPGPGARDRDYALTRLSDVLPGPDGPEPRESSCAC